MFVSAYGVYLPRKRISVDDIAKFAGTKNRTGISELAVPGLDDDSISMAINSARIALDEFNIKPEEIDAVVFGTNTNPYSNKSVAPIIVEALELNDDVQTFELSCGIRTGIRSLILGYMLSRTFKNILCITSESSRIDKAQIMDVLPSSGSVAFVISQNGFANIKNPISFNREFLDLWSRNGREYFFDRRSLRHTYDESFDELFRRIGGNDYDTLIIYVPDISTGLRLLKQMKIEQEKVAKGMVLPLVGNTFSVSPLLGLTKAFEDGARNILIACCGSGGGDAVTIEVKNFTKTKLFYQQLNDKQKIGVYEFLNLMEVCV